MPRTASKTGHRTTVSDSLWSRHVTYSLHVVSIKMICARFAMKLVRIAVIGDAPSQMPGIVPAWKFQPETILIGTVKC